MTGLATPSRPGAPKEVAASGPLTVNATFSTTDNSFFIMHNGGHIEGYVYFSVLRADGTALTPSPKLEEISLIRLDQVGVSQVTLSDLVTTNSLLHRVSFMDRPATDIDQIYFSQDYINRNGEPDQIYRQGSAGLKYLAYMFTLTRGALKHPAIAGFTGTAFLSAPVLALDDNDRIYLKKGIAREADTDPLPVKYPFPLVP